MPDPLPRGERLPKVVVARAGGEWIGRRLGKYDLLGLLGRGGMGVVYEAEDTVLRRRVALKLLPPALAESDRQALHRFLREARAAAQLNHPNVVAVYDVVQDGEVHYLVMELARRGSAQDYLRRHGRFAWPKATRVVADLCRGLAAAHEQGLIHRDLKPANVMRSADKVVKLADFGLAKPVGGGASLTGSGIVGTPDYMSPEQCRGEPLDARTDLYSLGATYYALLVGRPPFPRDVPVQTMFAHCSSSVPDPRTLVADVPPGVSAVIRKAMAKRPAERYQSAAEMLADLKLVDADADAPFPNLPVRPATALAPAASRWRPVVRGGVVAATAVAVLLAVAGVRWWADWLAEVVSPRVPVVGRVNYSTLDIFPPGGGGVAARVAPAYPALDLGSPVEAVAFSPDGRLLAAGGVQGLAGTRAWDARTGAARFVCAAGLPVQALAFTPDGATLVTGAATGDVQRWDAATGQRQGNSVRVGGSVEALAVLPGGRVLAAVSDAQTGPKRLRLWMLDPDQPPRALEAGTDEVRAVALSLDGDWAAVDCLDQTVRVGQPTGGGPWRVLAAGGRVTGVAFGPGGMLAVATDHAVQLWDSATGERRAALPHARGEVRGLAFSPDGRTLAVSNGYQREWGSVTLWDVPGRAVVRTLPEAAALVRAVAFSPDGALLAAGDWTGAVRLWDVSDRPRHSLVGAGSPRP